MEWLKTIGLSQKQQDLYLYLLRHGGLTATELSDALKEQRTNIYLLVDKLIEAGLIVRDESQSVVRFQPVSPNRLQKLMNARQKSIAEQSLQLKKDLPNLLGLYHLHVAEEGMAYFEGLEGYSSALEDMIRSNLEVCVFGSTDIVSVRPDASEVLRKSLQRRALAKVSTRVIFDTSLEESKDLTIFISEATKKYMKHKFWGNQSFGHGEIAIYGGTLVFTSYDEKLISLVIKNPSLAQIFQSVFETAWESGN